MDWTPASIQIDFHMSIECIVEQLNSKKQTNCCLFGFHYDMIMFQLVFK